MRDHKALYPHKSCWRTPKIADAGKDPVADVLPEANADWVRMICCADINTAKGALDVAKSSTAAMLQIELTG